MTSTVPLSTFVVVVLALSTNASTTMMSKLSATANNHHVAEATDSQLADSTIRPVLTKPRVRNYFRIYVKTLFYVFIHGTFCA